MVGVSSLALLLSVWLFSAFARFVPPGFCAKVQCRSTFLTMRDFLQCCMPACWACFSYWVVNVSTSSGRDQGWKGWSEWLQ